MSMKDWMDVFRGATQEVAKSALRFDGAGPAAPAVKEPGAPYGAFIAIAADNASMHLGLSTTQEGCRALARSLLGMRTAVAITDEEVGDAVSELMNIIAGKVKSRVSDRDQSLRLGLPMFMKGEIQVGGGMERQSAEVQLGPVACQLQVFRRNRAAA
jgi:CheY-specific phosphatase CheX